jgi:hypothetical protein
MKDPVTPADQVTGIYSKFFVNGRSDWNSELLSWDEWCIYIRFLYDNILWKFRYNFTTRKTQMNDFRAELGGNEILGFFNKIGDTLGNWVQAEKESGLIMEPRFNTYVYPFIQDSSEQEKIGLISNIASLTESKFKVNGSDDMVPCMTIYEMFHFIYLMGMSNVGLKYIRDQDKGDSERYANTFRLVYDLNVTLFKLNFEEWKKGVLFFKDVYASLVGQKSDEFLTLADFGNDEEKMILGLNNMFMSFIMMKPQVDLATYTIWSPYMQTFTIKALEEGLYMGVKSYIKSELLPEEASNEILVRAAEEGVKKLVDLSVDSIKQKVDLAKLTENEQQKNTNSTNQSLVQTGVNSIFADHICFYYVKMNMMFRNHLEVLEKMGRLRLLI